MTTLEDFIANYMKHMPPEVSEIQRKETRRALLAGIIIYRNIAFDIGRSPIEIGETKLHRYDAELAKMIKEDEDERLSN